MLSISLPDLLRSKRIAEDSQLVQRAITVPVAIAPSQVNIGLLTSGQECDAVTGVSPFVFTNLLLAVQVQSNALVVPGDHNMMPLARLPVIGNPLCGAVQMADMILEAGMEIVIGGDQPQAVNQRSLAFYVSIEPGRRSRSGGTGIRT